eukprot:CAMPEP_0113316820 /NCGR_PEP_ID=MMETSP0010_2-20120614/11956_1 /TAXON_ID=216773 ORGANISM="Corethron hystrix, Strain 308" /NCGR_SAMPLE_ID=MMETSP0010_2 /ASSEMBLY_ACC=CAM_ASM_000155 /LENGTH=157 /DNA_ID=CAMNT_0000173639 /DNA_START=45 /DNA_END=518 /DNA_ORIENTATION=- /assembly_acc=CAM_ASM_000155
MDQDSSIRCNGTLCVADKNVRYQFPKGVMVGAINKSCTYGDATFSVDWDGTNCPSGIGAVTFGSGNVASGKSSSDSSISGGQGNKARGTESSVSGGYGNDASGNNASVSGGQNNEASENNASVSGGNKNKASGSWATVSGGTHNEASGDFATVIGGH